MEVTHTLSNLLESFPTSIGVRKTFHNLAENYRRKMATDMPSCNESRISLSRGKHYYHLLQNGGLDNKQAMRAELVNSSPPKMNSRSQDRTRKWISHPEVDFASQWFRHFPEIWFLGGGRIRHFPGVEFLTGWV